MNDRLTDLYLSTPVLSLYDGDDDLITAGDTIATPATPIVTPATPTSGLGIPKGDPDGGINVDPNARFDQDQVNKIVQERLAKDRRKNEEKFKNLEKTHQDLLANKAISDEDKAGLEESLEDLRRQHRTKEEQAKHEKRQLQDTYENELKEARDSASHWENQHKSFLVEKSLLEAAIAHEAYDPTQVFDIIGKFTKLVDAVDESGKQTGKLIPMVDLPDVDADTGKPIITQSAPMEAVERMTKMQKHKNLFKSNIVSGVGGNSTTGGIQPGADGHIELRDLTPDQFSKIYKDDPTKLGLRPNATR